MATKVVLGKSPKTITKEITFPMLDGTTGSIELKFKYRTRSEYSVFVDELSDEIRKRTDARMEELKAKAKAQTEAGERVDLSISDSEMAEIDIQAKADFIMGAVEGWNIDAEFNRASVEQLLDEVPQAANAITGSYREAMTEGRLGN